MKVVCISDTHCQHKFVDVPEGDILVHSGDFLGRGDMAELFKFNAWLTNQPHKYKIVVPGNHDKIFEKNEGMARGALSGATHILIDKYVEIEGLKIYGSPWQPEFNNWAFNLPRGEALKEKWSLIPENLDLLITHGPPKGILDTFPDWEVFDYTFTHLPKDQWVPRKIQVQKSVGCEELLEAVMRVKPKYHVFGHIHDSYGTKVVDGTTFVNASICTEEYKPKNKPIVLEIP